MKFLFLLIVLFIISILSAIKAEVIENEKISEKASDFDAVKAKLIINKQVEEDKALCLSLDGDTFYINFSNEYPLYSSACVVEGVDPIIISGGNDNCGVGQIFKSDRYCFPNGIIVSEGLNKYKVNNFSTPPGNIIPTSTIDIISLKTVSSKSIQTYPSGSKIIRDISPLPAKDFSGYVNYLREKRNEEIKLKSKNCKELDGDILIYYFYNHASDLNSSFCVKESEDSIMILESDGKALDICKVGHVVESIRECLPYDDDDLIGEEGRILISTSTTIFIEETTKVSSMTTAPFTTISSSKDLSKSTIVTITTKSIPLPITTTKTVPLSILEPSITVVEETFEDGSITPELNEFDFPLKTSKAPSPPTKSSKAPPPTITITSTKSVISKTTKTLPPLTTNKADKYYSGEMEASIEYNEERLITECSKINGNKIYYTSAAHGFKTALCVKEESNFIEILRVESIYDIPLCKAGQVFTSVVYCFKNDSVSKITIISFEVLPSNITKTYSATTRVPKMLLSEDSFPTPITSITTKSSKTITV